MAIMSIAQHPASVALVQLRKSLNTTQEEFAKLANVSKVTVARYETTHPPTGDTLLHISRVAARNGEMASSASFKRLFLLDTVTKIGKDPQGFVDFSSSLAGDRGMLFETLHEHEEWAYAAAFHHVLNQFRSPGPNGRNARAALKALFSAAIDFMPPREAAYLKRFIR